MTPITLYGIVLIVSLCLITVCGIKRYEKSAFFWTCVSGSLQFICGIWGIDYYGIINANMELIIMILCFISVFLTGIYYLDGKNEVINVKSYSEPRISYEYQSGYMFVYNTGRCFIHPFEEIPCVDRCDIIKMDMIK